MERCDCIRLKAFLTTLADGAETHRMIARDEKRPEAEITHLFYRDAVRNFLKSLETPSREGTEQCQS